MYHIHEIELRGVSRKISPEDGYSREADARFYAQTKAANRASRDIYAVVKDNAIVAAFAGAGLLAALGLTADLDNGSADLDFGP